MVTSGCSDAMKKSSNSRSASQGEVKRNLGISSSGGYPFLSGGGAMEGPLGQSHRHLS